MEDIKELGCAIIENALNAIKKNSIYKSKPKEREEAIDFIMGDRLDTYINFFDLELDSSYIRGKVRAIIEETTVRA